MTHFQIIILIIACAGILGGVTNFFLVYKIDFTPKECWILFFKSFLVSLCASITVPLFLQIISNNLLDNSNVVDYPIKNYFILAGFCVLASFFSKRFLEDLYDRIRKVEDKVDIADKKVDQLDANSQEKDKIDDLVNNPVIISSLTPKYSPEQYKSVIEAILDSKYTYRTLSGIMKSLKVPLTQDQVLEILEILKTKDTVRSKFGKSGYELWKVS